ncbi:MAG: hypothetical protein ACOYEV_16085 [Candidatus Nanopelagicales bacterium]
MAVIFDTKPHLPVTGENPHFEVELRTWALMALMALIVSATIAIFAYGQFAPGT